MDNSWFEPSHPDWLRQDGFSQEEARRLGEIATVSGGTARLYARRHEVSEALAKEQLKGLLAYTAESGRVYQHRTRPWLRLETPRSVRGYGVLLDVPHVSIISYDTTNILRTWIAVRNIRLNARA